MAARRWTIKLVDHVMAWGDSCRMVVDGPPLDSTPIEVVEAVGARTVDETLCRWAETKYDLAAVTDVAFEFADDGDYSELTPGEGPYMRVVVTYLGKQGVGPQRHKRTDAVYDTALIREILTFASPASNELPR